MAFSPHKPGTTLSLPGSQNVFDSKKLFYFLTQVYQNVRLNSQCCDVDLERLELDRDLDLDFDLE